jgi:hypothetical protein
LPLGPRGDPGAGRPVDPPRARRCRAAPTFKGSPKLAGSLPHTARGCQDERRAKDGRSGTGPDRTPAAVAAARHDVMAGNRPKRPMTCVRGEGGDGWAMGRDRPLRLAQGGAGPKVGQNFLDDLRLFDSRNDPHRPGAAGTDPRVRLAGLLDEASTRSAECRAHLGFARRRQARFAAEVNNFSPDVDRG